MKSSNKNRTALMLILLTVIITAFIFANSFLNFSVSHSISGFIMNFLFPDKTQNAAADDFLLRKAAHLIEYAFLGGAVMGLTAFCRRWYKKRLVGLSLFCVLAIAVIDEFIQGFSDRHSSVSDVLLDFFGAMLGFVSVLGIVYVIRYIKKKKASS